jgi:hypothetical protein
MALENIDVSACARLRPAMSMERRTGGLLRSKRRDIDDASTIG